MTKNNLAAPVSPPLSLVPLIKGCWSPWRPVSLPSHQPNSLRPHNLYQNPVSACPAQARDVPLRCVYRWVSAGLSGSGVTHQLPPAGPAASGPGSSASPLSQRERSHSPCRRQRALLGPGRAPLPARCLSGTGVTHRAAASGPCWVRAGLLCQPAVSAGPESLTAPPPAGPAASGPGSSASPASQRERSHSPRFRQQALLLRAGYLCQPAVPARLGSEGRSSDYGRGGLVLPVPTV
ncbi:uncharacterized protein LOC125722195 [Brienomyrus brachyistius]|uniref:uncharacterized protein LOC125722195 n=1 Tax=Brienomyrus brachyistius TaxID=42636 RepID=UPI0020B2FFAE|nr:uncharacterized protein LOC125722195 [Brienomyrus brachyistius]